MSKLGAGKVVTRLAPLGGWNTRDPLERMSGVDAPVLTNWIPAAGGLKTRPCFTDWANAGPNGAIGTLMEYAPPGGTAALFAAWPLDIYNVTSAGAIGASVYGSGALTSQYWSHTMMTSAAVSVLFMVNGADSPVHYNGTVWTNPVITGVTASTFRTVTNHKNRLWFTVGTLLAWYLPNNSIAGAATSFDLGPLAKRGGHLVNIATWTRDGGLGPDDYIVFLTSKGEAIIYSGTDPSSASTWGLVGVFQLPTPVGSRCMVRLGADLVVLTVRGIIPMSQAMTLAESGVVNAALTAKITPTFETATRSHASFSHWQIIEWPREKLLICNIPLTSTTSEQYVMSTETMGWCKWSSNIYNAHAWGLLGDDLFLANSGVRTLKVGGSSTSELVLPRFLMSFQRMGGPGAKRVTMTRTSMLAPAAFRPVVNMKSNYNTTVEQQTPTSIGTGTPVQNIQWIANNGFGHVFAPEVEWSIPTASVERMTLNTIDIMFEEGGPL